MDREKTDMIRKEKAARREAVAGEALCMAHLHCRWGCVETQNLQRTNNDMIGSELYLLITKE